jgi:hypothetical protein
VVTAGWYSLPQISEEQWDVFRFGHPVDRLVVSVDEVAAEMLVGHVSSRASWATVSV